MTKRIRVSTYLVKSPTEPAELIKPPPMRSVIGKVGHDKTKTDVIEAHKKLGYDVRAVNFGPDGVIVYVVGGPGEPFDSTKSGPRGSRRRRRR